MKIQTSAFVILMAVLLAVTDRAVAGGLDTLAFSSDISGRFQIYTQDLSNPLATPVQVTTAGSGSQQSRGPDWSSSSGIAYYFGASGVRGIHVIQPDGTGDVRLTPPSSKFPGDERDPSWSPDGKMIVYSRLFGTDYDLWIHDSTKPADQQDYPLLTFHGTQELQPAWSPDGSKIAFTTNVAGPTAPGSNQKIAVVDVFTDPATRDVAPTLTSVRDPVTGIYRKVPDVILLTDNTAINNKPTWSPDSRSIAFSSNLNGNRDIYRMNANLGACISPTASPRACQQFVQLTTDPHNDLNPAWSKDPLNNAIAFTSDRTGNRNIFAMSAIAGEADKAHFLPVTKNTATNDDPAWAPGLSPPPQLRVNVSIGAVRSGTLVPTPGTISVLDAFGNPVPGAVVAPIGPLGQSGADKLYVDLLGPITAGDGTLKFEAREGTFLPTNTSAEFAFTASALVGDKPTSVTVSQDIDVLGGGIPPADPPPPVVPPPPDKRLPLGGPPFTPAQKIKFANAAAIAAADGARDGLVSIGSLLVPGLTIFHIGDLALLAELYAYTSLLNEMANDPVDPNYSAVARPLVRQAALADLGSSTAVPFGKGLKDTLSSTGLSGAYLEALTISIDRYNSALAAGDIQAAASQRNAILAYEDALRPLFLQAGQANAELVDELAAAGLRPVTVNANDLNALTAAIAAGAFPNDLMNLIDSLDFSPDEIRSLETWAAGQHFTADVAIDPLAEFRRLQGFWDTLEVDFGAPPPASPVPEPDSIALLLLGCAATIMFVVVRRRVGLRVPPFGGLVSPR